MYTFPSPYWDDVSDEAVDLIQVLLAQNTEDRHTVDDALEHVWMTMEVPYFLAFFTCITYCVDMIISQ
jgi:serine/threonine protein kinase